MNESFAISRDEDPDLIFEAVRQLWRLPDSGDVLRLQALGIACENLVKIAHLIVASGIATIHRVKSRELNDEHLRDRSPL